MSIPVDPPPYGSPEWVEWRRFGLGASEMAAIAGLDPFKGEYEVWLTKKGLSETEASWPMTMGHLMEPVALDWSEATFGPLVRGETWSDPRWPHLFATLDARRERVGVEAKWSTRDHAEPPRHWVVQAQAQMALADLTAVEIVLVTPRKAPHLLATIERTADAEAICDMAEDWWTRYIANGDTPEPDGSRAANQYLDTMRGEDAAEANDHQIGLVAQLRQTRRLIAVNEAEEKRIVGALKASMAGIGSLTGPGFRVAWSAVKPRQTIDWQAVAHVMYTLAGVPPETYDAEVERHTTVGKETTRFAPFWDEEEQP